MGSGASVSDARNADDQSGPVQRQRGQAQDAEPVQKERDQAEGSGPVQGQRDKAEGSGPVQGQRDKAGGSGPVQRPKDQVEDSEPVQKERDEAEGSGPVQGQRDQAEGSGPVQGQRDKAEGSGPVQGQRDKAEGSGPVQGPRDKAEGSGPVQGQRDKAEGSGPVQGQRDEAEGSGPVQGQRDMAEGSGPVQGQRDMAEGSGPVQGQRDMAEGSGPVQGQRDMAEGSGPVQGQRDKAEGSGPVQGQRDKAEGSGPVQGQRDMAEGSGPVQRQKDQAEGSEPVQGQKDKAEDTTFDDVHPTTTASAKTKEEEPLPVSHTVDIPSEDESLSEEKDESLSEEKDETVEEKANSLYPPVPELVESEEVPLAFESFLHNNGALYSCFSQHGNRVYVDDSKGLQPFPNEWYNQGRFITATNETPSQTQAVVSSQQVISEPAVAKDDRSSWVYIQGKGTVMTYMFEERANICRYFDAQTGLWLLLPLQWEMNIDFVKERVKQVTSALPGLSDRKEITAALRQCSYDPDEVISVYLTIFGDVLFQPSTGEQNYRELESFRAHLEKERVIEDLKQKLQTKDKEAQNLFQRNSYLAREANYLTDVIQHLNQKVAELEADQQEAREKIRALQRRQRVATPPAKNATPPVKAARHKPGVNPAQLRQVSQLTRNLNVSNKQLRSAVRQALADLQNQLEQVKEAAGKMSQVEQESAGEVEELRSLYRKEALERKALYNKLLEHQGNIRVFCRCRGNSAPSTCLEAALDQEVVVIQKGAKKKFLFDKVYPPSTSQEEVFEGTLPIIASCVDGYNVCILAYGQTGSGKTYTMMGNKDKPGVNIRSVRELLRICNEKVNSIYTLKISMVEIYNESLNDLLSKNSATPLEIRAQGKSVSVPGLTDVEVKTEDDILNVMELGEKNRKIASTKMNTESSRSHLILTLTVEGTDTVSGVTSRGTLTLGDLAGSERISKTDAKGQRLVEAAAINKSLTSLGQVFSALKCNALHVPFRNSKLTHLLQPCLSGDAKCCVFVNVSPDAKNVVETTSTLQFGSSIRQVALGKATQHITPAKNTKADK